MEWKDFVAVGLVHFSKLRSSLDAEILALSSDSHSPLTAPKCPVIKGSKNVKFGPCPISLDTAR